MKMIFATRNENKIKEVSKLLPSRIQLVGLDDIGLTEEIPETSGSIEGNAMQKVQYVSERTDLPVFADDSGLEVYSLNGEPGVDSAHYSGSRSAVANNQLLLKNLEGKSDRRARFVTVFALNLKDTQNLFMGTCEGEIIEEPRGNDGFGYDPLFRPDGYEKTFGEMSDKEKSAISHRSRALKKLIDYLQ